MKSIGVLRFPGSNCDYDVYNAIQFVKRKAEWLWHEDHFDSEKYDGLVLPGGFSYGDYLRCGALAARSPAMKSVAEAAKKGVPVLGICNGFQILCEAGLLPGVLLRNQKLRFIDSWVDLESRVSKGFWSGVKLRGEEYTLPIAHGEGRYFLPEENLKALFDKDQILATYTDGSNLNGSFMSVAGVLNEERNVCALMPHPERAIDLSVHGEVDGLSFFEVFT